MNDLLLQHANLVLRNLLVQIKLLHLILLLFNDIVVLLSLLLQQLVLLLEVQLKLLNQQEFLFQLDDFLLLFRVRLGVVLPQVHNFLLRLLELLADLAVEAFHLVEQLLLLQQPFLQLAVSLPLLSQLALQIRDLLLLNCYQVVFL